MVELRWTIAEIAERLSADNLFEVVFERGGEITVELYSPSGTDKQKPHDRDELYIVASGSGTFSRGDETKPFERGDLLFVPAHVPHRFETFTEDFSTWVIFFGPVR